MVRHSWLLLFWKYLYFYFQNIYFTTSLHCLLAYIVSDKKSTERNLYLCSYVCNVSFFFLLGCPCFLYVSLQQFGYDVSRCFLSVSVYVYFLFGCARPQLWYVESWIHYNVRNLLVGMQTLSCGMWDPGQRLNLGLLCWECTILATRPPGKSQDVLFWIYLSCLGLSGASWSVA